jgi:CheY-like chemotaxis protein
MGKIAAAWFIVSPPPRVLRMSMNPSNAPSPQPRPLFMVDDDEVDRMLFERLVSNAQLTNPVNMFTRAEEIIDGLIGVLRGAPAPLVCFVDVRMPGMNGFDVVRWIRCQHPLDAIPVVMLSSSEELRDLNEAQHSGAQCYLAKFPSPEQLREIVREAERVAALSPENPFRLPNNLLLGPSPVAIS